jgi:hypothetical protein
MLANSVNQIIRNGETTWEQLAAWLCYEPTFDLGSFMEAIRNKLGVLCSLVPDEVLHGVFAMLDEDHEVPSEFEHRALLKGTSVRYSALTP